MAIHIMSADKWKTQRVKFLERLVVLAHIRNTVAIGGTRFVYFIRIKNYLFQAFVDYLLYAMISLHTWLKGAQWLSGRVPVLELRGCGFEPHRHHCIVSMGKTHQSLLSKGSIQEVLSLHHSKHVDWDVKNQIKQTHD